MSELKDICVDLELSKELKENKFPQDGIFMHQNMESIKDIYPEGYTVVGNMEFKTHKKDYSAPTTDKLLKELPIHIFNGKAELQILKKQLDDLVYCVSYSRSGELNQHFHYNDYAILEVEAKLPNALAKMWLYLKKNNLLETP